MERKDKKLEILFINDIKSLKNELLSAKTNHYLKNMLFCLRLVFRYNGENLDEFIDFYYYIEDLLNNNILMDLEELKIFIYRVTDLIVNIDDYNIGGDTLITEVAANLLQSLYLELETYKLVDKTDESDVWKNILLMQVKDQVVDFDILIDILNNLPNIEKQILQLKIYQGLTKEPLCVTERFFLQASPTFLPS